jgi:hypothetical protein
MIQSLVHHPWLIVFLTVSATEGYRWLDRTLEKKEILQRMAQLEWQELIRSEFDRRYPERDGGARAAVRDERASRATV